MLPVKGKIKRRGNGALRIRAACSGGMYSVLDSKRGRVFTYDSQGNLLYIFGGRGDQKGQFNQPCALIYNGDEILVADRSRNSVQVFAQFCEKTLHFKKNHILILFKIRRQSMDTDGQNKGFDP